MFSKQNKRHIETLKYNATLKDDIILNYLFSARTSSLEMMYPSAVRKSPIEKLNVCYQSLLDYIYLYSWINAIIEITWTLAFPCPAPWWLIISVLS